jgi:(R,R)-butanediol dehydrogenase / meso-butanediol dehydrogenase / diacetyl reductase
LILVTGSPEGDAMRAAVYYGREDVRLEEVAEPEPGPGQVKIQVGFNGICGSDLSEYFGGPAFTPTAPHPLTGAQIPVILGHEFGGRVEAIGEGVDDLAAGELVAVNPLYTCGECVPCRTGHANLCRIVGIHGVMAHGGGLSERTVVARAMVHRLPAGLTAKHAALVEPMAVSLRAVRRAEVEAGQKVLIFGGGPIGLGAFFASRWLGADPIMVEPSPDRRDVLTRLGVPVVLDPATTDVVVAVLDLTGGAGADATIDAAAVPSTLASGVAATARGGNFVLVGIPHERIPFDPRALFNEVTFRASAVYTDEFPATIEAMAAGAYPTDGWVSTIRFENIIEQGFEVLRAGKAVKILVEIDGERP